MVGHIADTTQRKPSMRRDDRRAGARARGFRPLRWFFAWVLAVALCTAAGATMAQTDEQAMERAGAQIARQLAEAGPCSIHRPTHVGIWPYDAREIPIAPALANRIYDRFLAGYLAAAPACFKTTDVRGIGVTLRLLQSTGADWDKGAQTLDELEANLGAVDFIVAGRIEEQGGVPQATFRAMLRQTSVAVASVGPIAIPETLAGGGCNDPAQALDRALDEIAKDLAGQAPDMQHLVVEGGYFQDTTARTGFGRHLETELVQRLAAAHGALAGAARLTIRNMHRTDSAALLQLRGAEVSARQIEDAFTDTDAGASGAGTSAYRLSFRYWPCDTAILLSVTLRDPDGVPHGWSGNVRPGALPPGMGLEPAQPVEAPGWDVGGEDFKMTGPRGASPSYRVGEKLRAMFRLAQDSWVYCFYVASDGETVQFLPNPIQGDGRDANFYEGGRLHEFPPRHAPAKPTDFEITITGETYGIEALRCFATSRDVRADLPEAMRGTSFEPVPPHYATRLGEVFQSLGATDVAAATLTVTVVE